MLNAELVNRELLRLSLHYPEAGYTPLTIEVLAEDWIEDLEEMHVSDKEFSLIIKRIRTECRYFPKISEAIKTIKEFRQSPVYAEIFKTSGLIEERHILTDEERARNKKLIGLLASGAFNKLPLDETITKICLINPAFNAEKLKKEFNQACVKN